MNRTDIVGRFCCCLTVLIAAIGDTIAADDDEIMKSVSSAKRGRPKLPNKWTRILTGDIDYVPVQNVFDVQQDIDKYELEMVGYKVKSKQEPSLIFYRKTFLE